MTAPTALRPAAHHDLVLHEGTAQLVDLMVPYVRDGAAAGDHVLVVGEADFVDAVLAAVPGAHGVRCAGSERYPGRELRLFRGVRDDLVDAHVRVRLVNQMPVMTVHQWYEWRRYEAAANVFLDPHSVWGACAYDTSAMAPDVLADLRASHSGVRSADGHLPSDHVPDLGRLVEGYLDLPPHPVEATRPVLELADPTPAAARHAVEDLATRCGLPEDAAESAVLAASETVTNGWLHGRAPVSLRAWAGPGRLTVTVSDTGRGAHPLVGLLPARPESLSGRGMWMLHQLVGDISHRHDDAGYTVRFSVDGATGAA